MANRVYLHMHKNYYLANMNYQARTTSSSVEKFVQKKKEIKKARVLHHLHHGGSRLSYELAMDLALLVGTIFAYIIMHFYYFYYFLALESTFCQVYEAPIFVLLMLWLES